jgi:hypothetical protein
MKRLPFVLVFAVFASTAFAGPSSASTWIGRQLPGATDVNLGMFGISCPSTSLCVAVGGGNTIASSTNPTGSAESWRVVYPGAGAGEPNQRQIKGVSCPSPQLCVAVNFEGLIYTSTNPSGDAGAWSVADIDPTGPSTHFYGVSCPSPTFCAAAAGDGRIATSTDPTGGAAAWSVAQLEGPLELRGISCVSPALCVAVGDNGDGIRPEPTDDGRILSSTNPLAGAWQQVQMPSGQGNLYGVSCPSPALCVTGNLLGNLVFSTNPIGPASAWTMADGGGTVQITDVDCPFVSRCVAVDNNGSVLTSTNPTGGASAWTFTNVIPYPGVDDTIANAMFGVSCPTVSLCAVAVKGGRIFTSEDPFAESTEPVKKKKGKRSRKRPKRPRTTIARAPMPTNSFAGRKYPARFRFFARKHVQVRGFVCKIDRRPLKRCRPPKDYLVGFGKHVFRVRAIGWTGLKGPVAVARFRVCRPVPSPTPLPPCWKHAPPVTPAPTR